MAKRIQEFAPGKAESVAFKAFNILGRLTKRELVINRGYGTVPYKNKWGKHLGILAFDKIAHRWYRMNFALNATDEIESFDIWIPGKDPLSIAPTYTMILNNLGISRAIYMIMDFILNTKEMYAFYQGIKENEVESEDNLPLRSLTEAKIDAYVPIAGQFLIENPQWIKPLIDGSGGYQSGTPLGREVLHAMQAYPGLSKMMPVNVTAVNSLGSKAIKLNPAIAQAAGVAPAQAKAGASSVVIPQVTSLAAGPSLTLNDIFDSMPEGSKYKTQVADMNRPDGPLGIIYDFKKTLLGMYNVSDEGKNLLIASGRGGTGKTYTIEETLASQGLSEGTHYKTIKGSASMRAPTMQRLLANAADMPFVVIDDADSVMKSREMANCLKTAMENNPGGRKMRILYPNPKGHKGEDDEFIEKVVPIVFKMVWITNNDPEQLWRSNGWEDGDIVAVMRRAKDIKFNFTNEEVMDLIQKNIASVMPDNEYITEKRKADLWAAMYKIVESRNLRSKSNDWKGISFGDYRDLLGEWYVILVTGGNDRDFFDGVFSKQFAADFK
jgi:hypothetical protein